MSLLEEIVANKRKELQKLKQSIPLEIIINESELAKSSRMRRPFATLFAHAPILIAEIKPKSPSAGQLIGESPLDIADMYAQSDADVISVLTDEKYFGGSSELLRDVRARVPQAVLRKDFIVDEYQVYETHVAGADAFLLIAAILDTDALADLISIGKALDLDALVEVHDEKDVESAISAGADVIGINNRDLKTLETNIEVTEKLAKLIPAEIPIIAESGIETADDVRRVRAAGVRGILVGTSILQSKDPLAKIKELKQALHD